jgi:RNA polymerase sigma-70 factor (ECF subfamily)
MNEGCIVKTSMPIDSTLRIAIPSVATPTAANPQLEEEVVGLFDQMRNRMLRYLVSLGLTAHDGEEVVQEVFLALFQHLQQGKSRENLRGWVFRVAHNLALKQRMLKRRESAEIAETADPALNPEEQMANSQRQARLLKVLRALPEQDQYCLHLRAEGLRYREIADVLGISLGSVSNSLGRSLGRLARADER